MVIVWLLAVLTVWQHAGYVLVYRHTWLLSYFDTSTMDCLHFRIPDLAILNPLLTLMLFFVVVTGRRYFFCLY